MPDHYALGVNMRHGEVQFNKSTKKKIKFITAFGKKPSVTLTLDDPSNAPPYKFKVKKDHFWIRFKGKYTGGISWEAKEMEL